MNFQMDGNEWFGIISSVVMMALFWTIRKHFQPIVIWIIWVFNITYVATIDFALAATPFELYYCGDNESYEPIATWIHVFLYPPFSFFFLYFYDKWSVRGTKLFLYLVLWTGISVVFEWINIKVHLIVFTGWLLFYSIPTYPISALILIKLYHYIQKNLPPGALKKRIT
jgi:hypothetical protein